MQKRFGVRREVSGAVLVEFAVAIFPLLAAFFVFFQVGVMVTAKMFVRRATIAAARAGIVITGGGASNPRAGGAEQGTTADIDAAFQAALGQWADNGMLTGTVTIAAADDVNAPLTATSNVIFKCNVPLGKNFVCSGGQLTFVDRATLPKQGAKYK
jgi:Flp pilus assembly protein TadG